MISPANLEAKIVELLDVFYSKRIASLEKTGLFDAIKKKNPYLYKAVGTPDASQIVEEILKAFVSSSDEALFGNEFFEPLAKWVAEVASPTASVQTGGAAGVDVQREYPDRIEAIAVKSGTRVFNAQSKKKQIDQFRELRNRFAKLRKRYDPIVLYCYGRKNSTGSKDKEFAEFAGQKCWEHLTGDPEMYLKIARLMGDKPKNHWNSFMSKFNEAKNRCLTEFLKVYSTPEGKIDWEKLIKENSGGR